MKMTVDIKCHIRSCQHRLTFEVDQADSDGTIERATENVDRLVNAARERGWEWGRLTPAFCPDHKDNPIAAIMGIETP